MDHFELHAPFKPTGDQPQAIEKLVEASKKVINFRLCWVLRAPERPLPWPM